MVQRPFRDRRARTPAIAFVLSFLVVFVLTTSSVEGSAVVSFSPPYSGFSVIRYIHNTTTGGNLTCGVSMFAPALGRVINSNGEMRVKVSLRVAACGGTFSAVNYSGRLGLTSTNFTVPSTGLYRLGSWWLVGYKALMNVTSPTNNGSVTAALDFSLHIELVNLTSGVTFAQTTKPIWNANLSASGQYFTAFTVHNKFLARAGIHLGAHDRYEIKAYLQFDLSASIQPWVAKGSSVWVWLDMAPTRTYRYHEARIVSLDVS